jgi:hypothetical protein
MRTRESVLGFPLADATVGNVRVRDVGQRGEAAVETLDPEGYVLDGTDDFVEYVYEDGSWLINDCGRPGGGGSDTTGSDTSD